MEKFYGSFRIVAEKSVGFDGWAKAMNLPEAVSAAIAKNIDITTALYPAEGGTIRDFTDYGTAQEEFFFKLGETVTPKFLGVDAPTVFKLDADGKTLRGEHSYLGVKNTSARYFAGDLLAVDLSAKGATFTAFYKKVDDMEKFYGRFKMLPSMTKGFEEWATAMGLPEEVKKSVKSSTGLVIALEKVGDKVRDFTDYGGGKTEEFLFSLGQSVTSTILGTQTKTVFRMDPNGQVLRGDHDFGGAKNTSARYFDLGLLAVDTEANGKVFTSYYQREEDIQMEKFLGRFRVISDKTKGFEQWAKAVGLPESVVKASKPKNDMISCLEKRGQRYRDFTDYGENKTEDFFFALNRPALGAFLGTMVQYTFRMDGDGKTLRMEHEFNGYKHLSARYFCGDQLVVDMTANGATLTTYLERIDTNFSRFIGRFRIIPDKTTGFEAWAKLIGLPDELAKLFSSSDAIIGLEREGDCIRDYTDYQNGMTEEFLFREGHIITHSFLGKEAKSIFRLDADGKVLRGEHVFEGIKHTSARYFSGDLLAFEFNGNGIAMTTYYTRLA